MKQIIALIVIFVAIAYAVTTTTVSNSAITYQDCFIDINFGTMTASTDNTQKQAHVDVSSWKTIDSVGCSVYGTGELDVDSVDIYIGVAPGYHGTTAYTRISSLDLAASTKGFSVTYPAVAADCITQALMRGAKNLKVQTRGAISGVGTTNNCHVLLQIYGTKE